MTSSSSDQSGVSVHKLTSNKRTTGHDTVLRALQNKGKQVTIEFCGGEDKIVGTIVAFDPYTITIRGNKGTRSVIFKHDVRLFTAPEDVSPTLRNEL